MGTISFWSRDLSRIELDARSREARLRLEQLERLLVSHTIRGYRRRRLPFFGFGRNARALKDHQVKGPRSDQRHCGTPRVRFSESHLAA